MAEHPGPADAVGDCCRRRPGGCRAKLVDRHIVVPHLVVAVGPGKMNDKGERSPLDVKAGDRVLIGKYSGSEIKYDDTDYVIVREDEILAVLNGAK